MPKMKEGEKYIDTPCACGGAIQSSQIEFLAKEERRRRRRIRRETKPNVSILRHVTSNTGTCAFDMCLIHIVSPGHSKERGGGVGVGAQGMEYLKQNGCLCRNYLLFVANAPRFQPLGGDKKAFPSQKKQNRTTTKQNKKNEGKKPS